MAQNCKIKRNRVILGLMLQVCEITFSLTVDSKMWNCYSCVLSLEFQFPFYFDSVSLSPSNTGKKFWKRTTRFNIGQDTWQRQAVQFPLRIRNFFFNYFDACHAWFLVSNKVVQTSSTPLHTKRTTHYNCGRKLIEHDWGVPIARPDISNCFIKEGSLFTGPPPQILYSDFSIATTEG